MDYRIDGDAETMRAALLEFLRERMPDPGSEPTGDRRRAAWRELVGSDWLEHFGSGDEAGPDPAERVTAMYVAEAFGAAPTTGPVDTVAGYLLPLTTVTGWGDALDRLRDGSLVTGRVPDLGPPGPDAVPWRSTSRLRAGRDGGSTRVSGALGQVSCAGDADAFAVAVELDGTPALVLIDADQAGVTVGGPSGVDLRRPVADVLLDGAVATSVHMPPGLRLAEDACASLHSLFLDAEAVGGATEAIARTVSYCTDRVQFGRPVGSFQALRHRLADATARVEGARSLANRAAWDLADNSPTARVDVVASRLWSSGAYVAAAEAAVQCHGGMGFTWEQGVHVFYRAALAGRGGTDVPRARATIAAHLRALAGEPDTESLPMPPVTTADTSHRAVPSVGGS